MSLGKIVVIGEDVAAEAVGIMGFMPSPRHLMLAKNAEHATEIKELFKQKFSINLSSDYMSDVIGRRLGVIALAFCDESGQVIRSDAVVEVPDIQGAKMELPQIRHESGSHARDTGGPFR